MKPLRFILFNFVLMDITTHNPFPLFLDQSCTEALLIFSVFLLLFSLFLPPSSSLTINLYSGSPLLIHYAKLNRLHRVRKIVDGRRLSNERNQKYCNIIMTMPCKNTNAFTCCCTCTMPTNSLFRCKYKDHNGFWNRKMKNGCCSTTYTCICIYETTFETCL